MKRININLLLAFIAIILLNIVAQEAYLRFDLTERDVYSLSPVSRELVRTVDNPLRVHVFFSDDVPAVYGTVRQYLLDVLSQYESAGGQRFTFEVHPMSDQAGRETASSYGVNPIQIREVRQDQFQQSQAYMGVAILYGDRIETVNRITSTEGLEYRLTTTMQSMVRAVDALSGIAGSVEMNVYASQNLDEIGIDGLAELEESTRSVYQELNEQNAGKLEFSFSRPGDTSRVEELNSRYGLQQLSWQSRSGGERVGVLGIVLQHQDAFETVPIQITQTLGGYRIESAEQIRTRIEDSLTVLVSANPRLAYVTGHGEKDLSDRRRGAGTLRSLFEGRYEITSVELSGSPIPEGVQTVIINGPRQQFSDWELYQLDQFLMRGGSLLAMVDPFEQSGGQRQRPSYRPINSGLGELLSHYGVTPQQNYALDTESYVARQQQRQDVQVYNAPMVSGERLSQESVITRGLNQALFLNSSSVTYEGQESDSGESESGISYTALARTSENGWLMSENITLNPMMLRPPQDQERGPATLAVLAEGRFTSYFSEPVSPPAEAAEPGTARRSGEAAGAGAPAGAANAAEAAERGETGERAEPAGESVLTQAYVSEATSPGRLLVAGTSEIAGAQLLGQGQQSPNTILIQNMVDYLNGNEAIPPMRTKGLGASRLDDVPAVTRTLIRVIHVAVVPALVVIIGLLVWARRRQLRRLIQRRLSPGGEL